VDGNFFACGAAPIWLAAVSAHAHASLMQVARELSRVISRKVGCKAAVKARAISLKKSMLTVGSFGREGVAVGAVYAASASRVRRSLHVRKFFNALRFSAHAHASLLVATAQGTAAVPN